MKNEIMVFTHEVFGEIRITDNNGDAWFVAGDIAKALGYNNPAEAVRDHCRKANKISHHSKPLPPVNMLIIPESDVYRLIMRSQLPSAERFQDWVTDEVLPSIRKTGGYSITKDDSLKSINLHEVADHLESSIKIASLLGLDKNQQIHSANTMVKRLSGFDCMREFGVTAIEYKENIQYHTPSILGDMAGISSVKMNRILEEKGLQYETRDHKNKLVWVVTPKGKEYSRLFDTTKFKSDGTPITQIKWAESVLSI